MLTIHPYTDFTGSVQCLNYNDLNMAYRSATNILNCLEKLDLKNHKDEFRADERFFGVFMWLGYEDALKCYQRVAIEELAERNRADYVAPEIPEVDWDFEQPWWLTNMDLRENHRANLCAGTSTNHYISRGFDRSISSRARALASESKWMVMGGKSEPDQFFLIQKPFALISLGVS